MALVLIISVIGIPEICYMAIKNETLFQEAKALYLQVDADGKRMHSFREIATILTQKGYRQAQYSTIARKAKKEGWDALFLAGKSLGKEKAIADAKDQDDELLNAVANDIAQRRTMAIKKKLLADELIMSTLQAEKAKIKEAPADKPYFNTIDLKTLQTISASEEGTIENIDGASGGSNQALGKFLQAVMGIDGSE